MDEQLKVDIWSIWKILLDCQENLMFSKYLYKPDTEEESILDSQKSSNTSGFRCGN